ncbi:MAG: glycosyltransferase [Frankia sp.]
MPESAHGPTNNCIGIGDALRRRGHQVVFAAEASWAGQLTPLGFTEELIDLAPPEPAPDGDGTDQTNGDGTGEPDATGTGSPAAGQFWIDFIRDTAPEFRKPTIDALATFVRPTWQALIDGARYAQDQLTDVIARTRPDVIVEDNVVGFPALLTAGVPFVRIVSCQPLEIGGAGAGGVDRATVPPPFSGLPATDPTDWAAFRTAYDELHRPLWSEFDAWMRDQGAPPLPDLEFIHTSEAANLYVYPEIADYTAVRPLDRRWHRLDSSVRATDAAFTPPPELLAAGPADPDAALIYLSLGSLGSADLDLMRRLVGILADTPHRYIVSTGPRGDELVLPPNMWGRPVVPQTAVLPHCDLVITHGGNNTTTEALHFGTPMVVLPLFWDQHDNAQRMAELGLGIRLAPYDATPGELTTAVAALLGDRARRDRLAAEGARIRARDGLRRAADLLEGLAP